MTTALLLFLLLTGTTENQYHLARAIEGERPDLVNSSPELAEHVGHVVLNRLEAGWCDSIYECVDGGFWGAGHVLYPQQWALDAASNVLTYGKERVSEAFYVFSLEDCNRLELSLEDALLVVRNERFGLVFYDASTEWKGE